MDKSFCDPKSYFPARLFLVTPAQLEQLPKIELVEIPGK